MVSGRLMPKMAYPVLRGPLKGTRFVLGAPPGEGGGATIFFNGYEPEQSAAFLREFKPGQMFFDIGANIGYYTLLGAKLVGPAGAVFAFEPSIRNLSCLHRHLLLNGSTNVSVLAAACSDAPTLASFSAGPNFGEGHLDAGDSSASGAASGTWTLVPTVTVDSVVARIGIAPDIMKIDVEGAEMEVLRGAENTLQNKRPKIFLSVHSSELRRNCLEYLAGFGYGATPIDPASAEPMEYLLT